jgi:hypothetical protein
LQSDKRWNQGCTSYFFNRISESSNLAALLLFSQLGMKEWLSRCGAKLELSWLLSSALTRAGDVGTWVSRAEPSCWHQATFTQFLLFIAFRLHFSSILH